MVNGSEHGAAEEMTTMGAGSVSRMVRWPLRGFWLRGAFAALLIVSGTDVAALEDDDPKRCVYEHDQAPDIGVQACSRLIESGRLSDKTLASVFDMRGHAYALKKQYDLAVADYDEAIRLDPNLERAVFGRGSAYFYKRQYERAIADFSRAIRLKPDKPESFHNRGTAYFNLEQLDPAIADFDQALRLAPDKADSWAYRGRAYFHKKDYDRAIADLDQAIRLNPKDAASLTFRGKAYFGKKELERANEDFTQAIRLDPKHADAYAGRAGVSYRRNDYDQALQDLDEAIRLNPEEAWYLSKRSQVLRKKEQHDAALEEKSRAAAAQSGTEDRHGILPTDYFIADGPYAGTSLYVHVAEMRQPPAAAAGGAALFHRLTDARELRTAHFWATRPANAADLAVGSPAICFTSNEAGNVFDAPMDQRHARTGGWLLGQVTDLSHVEHGLVGVDRLNCSLAAVRVPAAREANQAAGVRGHAGGQGNHEEDEDTLHEHAGHRLAPAPITDTLR
ncbi:MAG: tetratricopeptide repeat protein [Nitrospirota bacterium]